jgi:hypothetical protein
VPQGPSLSTAVRAQERAKFDEALKERDRVLEQLKLERQREKELEEESERRELRKKTDVKANAVPDWYADAPKKSSVTMRNKGG